MPPRASRPPQGRWAQLADALAGRRRLLGLTQREAADLSDLCEKAVRDIESGAVAPRVGALVAVAASLGLDLVLVPSSHRRELPPGALRLRPDDGPEPSRSDPGRSDPGGSERGGSAASRSA